MPMPKTVEIVISVIAYGLLWKVGGWKFPLGVLLAIWANNIMLHAKFDH